MELRGQRRKLPFRRNRIPAGLVDRDIFRRAIKEHSLDVAVGKYLEAYVCLTLLGDRRLRFLGDQWKPVALDVRKDALQVGLEVDSLRVGENVHSTAKRVRRARAELRAVAITVAVGHLVDGVLQVLARASSIGVEVRLGGILRLRSFGTRRR